MIRQIHVGKVFASCVLALCFAGFVATIFLSARSEQIIVNADVSALPMRLRIPALSLDVSVESVGLLDGGILGAPSHPYTVGWFNKGPRPGDIGSAVMDGHFGWRDGIPAAFDRLSTLGRGDELFCGRYAWSRDGIYRERGEDV